MTELFEIEDPADHRLALSAGGMLRTFNDAGVLTAADVHVATRTADLAGERDETVRLAAALAVRAVRHGSVCLHLSSVTEVDPELPWPDTERWQAAVAASPLVTRAGVLRWDHGLLYLDRYWQQEGQVCDDLRARAAQPPPSVDESRLEAGLRRLFPGHGYDEQRTAAAGAARRWTTVLTGGPGTGKTTTISRLLALLADHHDTRLRIALAAPTGKAAARLQQAVHDAMAAVDFPAEDRDRLGEPTASTLHRLLGSRPDNSTRFRHHRGNRLPHDVVVVDETSMVSLTLMARLLEAVRPDARLVLVGDPDQLASVEAGAVLKDLVEGLEHAHTGGVVRLRTTHRFGREIGAFADAIRSGDADRAVQLLEAGGDGITFVRAQDDEVEDAVRSAALADACVVLEAAEAGDADGALAGFTQHRLLCAHRDGPFGVRHWNHRIERWLAASTGTRVDAPWYAGRPLLVTANDYGLGLFNGDTGVVVRDPASDRLVAAMATGAGPSVYALSRLSDVETAHAMTVHRSQGSQFDEVTVLLPPEDSPLLTRELFYTAVTRARRRVRVIGGPEAVRAAVTRTAQRASGLAFRL